MDSLPSKMKGLSKSAVEVRWRGGMDLFHVLILRGYPSGQEFPNSWKLQAVETQFYDSLTPSFMILPQYFIRFKNVQQSKDWQRMNWES